MRLAGVQPWLKSWGQGLGPNTGALAPRPWPKAGLGVGCGGGHPLPLLGSGGIIFENSVAKSCILVTACCEISCFFENYGQEVGGPMHCWSLQPKSWSPVPAVVVPMAAWENEWSVKMRLVRLGSGSVISFCCMTLRNMEPDDVSRIARVHAYTNTMPFK